MAKMRSIIPMSGSIGNMSFYNDKQHGEIARRKGGPTKEQISKGKNFAPVRRNNTEFGKASSYNKLLRAAFASLIKESSDYWTSRRLQKVFTDIIKADNYHAHGQRRLDGKNLTALDHFNINRDQAADMFFDLSLLKRKVSNERMNVDIYSRFPLLKYKQATHFKVLSAVACIDFARNKYEGELVETEIMPVSTKTIAHHLQHTLKGKGHAFHGFCISFYLQDGGRYYSLENKILRGGGIQWVG